MRPFDTLDLPLGTNEGAAEDGRRKKQKEEKKEEEEEGTRENRKGTRGKKSKR